MTVYRRMTVGVAVAIVLQVRRVSRLTSMLAAVAVAMAVAVPAPRTAVGIEQQPAGMWGMLR